MEYYRSYGQCELKNKWQSQKISKKYKNRHIKKSKPNRNRIRVNKKSSNKRKRLSQNISTSNSSKSNKMKSPEQQFICYNYSHIQTTITMSIYYHCKPLKGNKKPKLKKLKKTPCIDTPKQEIPLTKTEQNAVDYIKKRAMGSSTRAHKKLVSRLSRLNCVRNRNLLQNIYSKVMAFIQNSVPMIIHVPPSTIPKLLQDTHYRNLFEIGTGNGCTNKDTRKQYEREMFGDCYANTMVKATERPKYGCLNIGLNENGTSSAHGYGRAFFTLNDATVRWRVSVTTQDSFQSNGVFGTLGNCAHLLNNLQDVELEEICETAIYEKQCGTYRTYREIQIHGPVLLKRDIASLHVPASERSNAEIYEKFAQKNSCDLIWF